MAYDPFSARSEFHFGDGKKGTFYSLPALQKAGVGAIDRLPVSIRVVLEAVLRHCDGKKITPEHVRELANWQPHAERTAEIPFVVARIVLQDFTGVPLLADLAAMRGVASSMGRDPKKIEPLVPVNLVVDHSVQVDHYGSADALKMNMELEFSRNQERYQFMKWGMQAFDTFKVVPPGIGIVHQVNLEYLARGIVNKGDVYYPDTLVGTDSHTTMINGVGVVGWGVGGIEAEAGMLGQPVYFLTPDVVGVHLSGQLREGVTATDLVLTLTQLLRKTKVVGKFVEFFGPGAATLAVTDRATIANMAPEYGATMGFFPVDQATARFFEATGRTADEVSAFVHYYQAQGLFGMPQPGAIDYSQVVELDLSTIVPSLAGPKRPQDRIELTAMKSQFQHLFSQPVAANGFGKTSSQLAETAAAGDLSLTHGDILIAAITSCTNTSNPSVLLAAGLLAQKAVARGLKVAPHIKTSLAPGSRVVTQYLQQAGLLKSLEALGFHVVGYGCTTCIGNSGPLDDNIERAVTQADLVCAAVLSGNRNFEARIHGAIKANFLASPPLVVAYAIAGNVQKDLSTEALGLGSDGKPVYLADIWPSNAEIEQLLPYALNPSTFTRLYADFTSDNPLWAAVKSSSGDLYAWDQNSTYIAEPPFFDQFSMSKKPLQPIQGARILGIFSDSVTTDHISPAGNIKSSSPAGRYLQEKKVSIADFNSYGARRGNHEIMMRGTFANVRIKNLMLGGKEGGHTLLQPQGQEMSIYDAAMAYQKQNIPTVVFAGEEYGTGSSRDWAAKGTQLLGVKAVIAKSFERIHRSNLVGMGVLPLQFIGQDSAQSLALLGDEIITIEGTEKGLAPQQKLVLLITSPRGQKRVEVLSRIDTPIEVDYFESGGILPYVLRDILAQ